MKRMGRPMTGWLLALAACGSTPAMSSDTGAGSSGLAAETAVLIAGGTLTLASGMMLWVVGVSRRRWSRACRGFLRPAGS